MMDALIWLPLITLTAGYIIGIYVGRHYDKFTEEEE